MVRKSRKNETWCTSTAYLQHLPPNESLAADEIGLVELHIVRLLHLGSLTIVVRPIIHHAILMHC